MVSLIDVWEVGALSNISGAEMSFGDFWAAIGPLARGVVTGATVASVIGGAVVAIPPAWNVLGLPVLASQGYVQVETGRLRVAFDGTRAVALDTQIELAEGKREATDETLFKWNIEVSKATDPQTQALIRMRMRELEAQKSKIESQLKTLYEARQSR